LVEPGAPLRRIEAAGLGLALPQHVGERARGADHLADRLAAAGAHQIVRVLPLGQQREFDGLAGLDVRQRKVDRPVGGAPAGAIAVEAEHRLVGHLP
jgi:hypothetical protein